MYQWFTEDDTTVLSRVYPILWSQHLKLYFRPPLKISITQAIYKKLRFTLPFNGIQYINCCIFHSFLPILNNLLIFDWSWQIYSTVKRNAYILEELLMPLLLTCDNTSCPCCLLISSGAWISRFVPIQTTLQFLTEEVDLGLNGCMCFKITSSMTKEI